jgi:hypothetical protein
MKGNDRDEEDDEVESSTLVFLDHAWIRKVLARSAVKDASNLPLLNHDPDGEK